MPEHQIAFLLGLDLSELRARYALRMRRAAIDANLEIWETLWTMARSGQNTAATFFWLQTRAWLPLLRLITTKNPLPPSLHKRKPIAPSSPRPAASKSSAPTELSTTKRNTNHAGASLRPFTASSVAPAPARSLLVQGPLPRSRRRPPLWQNTPRLGRNAPGRTSPRPPRLVCRSK